jgi:hypothetical protein
MIYKDTNDTYYYQFQLDKVTYKERGFTTKMECTNAAYEKKNSLDVFYVKRENNICFDYFSFTFEEPAVVNMTVAEAIKEKLSYVLAQLYLNNNKYEVVEDNKDGYQYSMTFDENVTIRYGGNAIKNISGKNTVMFEMKGSACRLYEQRMFLRGVDFFWGYECFLKYCYDTGFKATRIDIAFDDFNGIITWDELYKYLKDYRSFVCSCHGVKGHWGFETRVSTNGDTIELGSRTSNFMLQIYNKKVEREQMMNLFTNLPTWTRYELRARHESAVNLHLVLIDGYKDSLEVMKERPKECLDLYKSKVDYYHDIPKILKEYMFAFLKIKEITDDKNVSRRENWYKWEYLLQCIGECKIKNQGKLESSILSKRGYFGNHYARFKFRFYCCDYMKNGFIIIDKYEAAAIMYWLKNNALDNKDINMIMNDVALDGIFADVPIKEITLELEKVLGDNYDLDELAKKYGFYKEPKETLVSHERKEIDDFNGEDAFYGFVPSTHKTKFDLDNKTKKVFKKLRKGRYD